MFYLADRSEPGRTCYGFRVKAFVSILIPAYDAEAWIGKAIESALSQIWTDKEVVVVDDGSRDDTAAVL